MCSCQPACFTTLRPICLLALSPQSKHYTVQNKIHFAGERRWRKRWRRREGWETGWKRLGLPRTPSIDTFLTFCRWISLTSPAASCCGTHSDGAACSCESTKEMELRAHQWTVRRGWAGLLCRETLLRIQSQIWRPHCRPEDAALLLWRTWVLYHWPEPRLPIGS